MGGGKMNQVLSDFVKQYFPKYSGIVYLQAFRAVILFSWHPGFQNSFKDYFFRRDTGTEQSLAMVTKPPSALT